MSSLSHPSPPAPGATHQLCTCEESVFSAPHVNGIIHYVGFCALSTFFEVSLCCSMYQNFIPLWDTIILVQTYRQTTGGIPATPKRDMGPGRPKIEVGIGSILSNLKRGCTPPTCLVMRPRVPFGFCVVISFQIYQRAKKLSLS